MLVSMADNAQSSHSEEMDSITLESFVVPPQIKESSISDDTPVTKENSENPVVIMFELIEDGLQKG